MKTELQQKLDENIPKAVIHTREQAGRSLSYLETWYVIDRMNQIFGQGNWEYSIRDLSKVFEGKVEQYSGEVYATSYVARIAVSVTTPEGRVTTFEDVGYGDGTDKKNPGQAHELAVKEAVSDGIKRAAKNLGRSMGLALYDKTQEFVGKVSSPAIESSIPANAGRSEKGAADSSSIVPTAALRTESASKTSAKKPIKELVTAAFTILKLQKKITADEFKEKYQKGKGLSLLSDEELTKIYKSVKKAFPELNV